MKRSLFVHLLLLLCITVAASKAAGAQRVPEISVFISEKNGEVAKLQLEYLELIKKYHGTYDIKYYFDGNDSQAIKENCGRATGDSCVVVLSQMQGVIAGNYFANDKDTVVIDATSMPRIKSNNYLNLAPGIDIVNNLINEYKKRMQSSQGLFSRSMARVIDASELGGSRDVLSSVIKSSMNYIDSDIVLLYQYKPSALKGTFDEQKKSINNMNQRASIVCPEVSNTNTAFESLPEEIKSKAMYMIKNSCNSQGCALEKLDAVLMYQALDMWSQAVSHGAANYALDYFKNSTYVGLLGTYNFKEPLDAPRMGVMLVKFSKKLCQDGKECTKCDKCVKRNIDCICP